MSNLEDLLQARLAELRNPTTDLEARIAGVLAAHDKFTYDAEHRETTCAECGWAITNVMNPDHEDKFHERKRVHQAQVIAAALPPVVAEAQAEALREAADSLDAHADKNERDVRQTAWGTRANPKGTYWAVRRVRITARWLRARADKLRTL